jgi:hypothetical protein
VPRVVLMCGIELNRAGTPRAVGDRTFDSAYRRVGVARAAVLASGRARM